MGFAIDQSEEGGGREIIRDPKILFIWRRYQAISMALIESLLRLHYPLKAESGADYARLYSL